MADFIGESIANMLLLLGAAFFFMISVGVAHHEWISTLPTIGYAAAILLTFTSYGVVGLFATALDKDSK